MSTQHPSHYYELKAEREAKERRKRRRAALKGWRTRREAPSKGQER